VPGWLPHELAEECARHEPGPPANALLRIEATFSLTESHEVLLRRAFQDFAGLRAARLFGGANPNVWRIDAAHNDGRACDPFVVKADRRMRITEEIEVVEQFVNEYVPFPNRAPVSLDRCVSGAHERLIVSMFVDRAMRLDEYILSGSPGQVITNLFDVALRTWRANRRMEARQVGKEFGALGIFGRTQLLQAVARNVGATVASPQELVRRLQDLPQQEIALAYGHGDLHPRNIYVRHNTAEVVLIDFPRSGEMTALSRDPATLDVALALYPTRLDSPTRKRVAERLSRDVIRRLYTPPLLPLAVGRIEDPRIEAVRHIRVQVQGDGISEAEYEIAVASYLLRFAERGDVMALRALAYELADRLLNSVSRRG